MAGEESKDGGLYIDSDWKEEAAREKRRLVEQEEKEKRERPASGAPAGPPQTDFLELVNLIAMQAAVSLGGLQDAGGERIPPNPVAARHFIDLLETLEKKTEGNLTDDEKRVLSSVLYELRMQYVQAVSAPPAPPPGQDKGKK